MFLGSQLGLLVILESNISLQMENHKNLKCHLEHLKLPCGRVCSQVNLYKRMNMDFSYSWEILSNSNSFQCGRARSSLKLNAGIYYCV